MTCLDSKINFLPNGGVCGCAKQVIIRFGKSQTIRNVFTTLNRHYYGMAGWIELNYYNSFCCQRCQTCWCVGVRVYLWGLASIMYLCVCISVRICICGWQVRDRRGLARLNYVYDYILLQTQCHRTHAHIYTVINKWLTHTHTLNQEGHVTLYWSENG